MVFYVKTLLVSLFESFPNIFLLVGCFPSRSYCLNIVYIWEIHAEPENETFWYGDCRFTWATLSSMHQHSLNCIDKLDSERGTHVPLHRFESGDSLSLVSILVFRLPFFLGSY